MLLGYLHQDIPANIFMPASPKHFISALCYQDKVECRFAILMAKLLHSSRILKDGLIIAQAGNWATPSFFIFG
jgi:hypothetical protein